MHFLPDDQDPYGITRTLVDALPPGSFLVLSHGTADQHPELRQETETAYKKGAIALRMRTRVEVERFFDGLELVEPGLVPATEWYRQEAGAGRGAQRFLRGRRAGPVGVREPQGVMSSSGFAKQRLLSYVR